MKAQKLYTIYDKYSNTVVYQYRNHTYDVEYPKATDYCVSEPAVQHKNAQALIDSKIDTVSDNESNPVDIDEIFEILGW